MRPHRNREWVSESEWRKRKRGAEKRRLEARRLDEVARAEKYAKWEKDEAIRRAKTESIGTKLWAWGINSEKHPTYSLGVIPWVIVMLVGVPILGILYKLSFTWVSPLIIAVVAMIAWGYRKLKQ